MPSRLTAHALAALAAAAVTVVGLAATPQAAAQAGNGLYEPFPEAAVKERAQRYVDRLRARTGEPQRRYSDGELAAGVFPRADRGDPSLRPASPRADQAATRAEAKPATARAAAGAATDRGLALTVQFLILATGLSVPAWALARRARTRAA